ncbi:BTB/POZ domain-containing protein 2-like [Amblyomma americanum]
MGRYCFRCKVYDDGVVRCNAETQCGKNLSEFSLAKFLGSADLTDVEFTVESQHYPGKRGSFKAHRLILALHIEDFKAMFYGEGVKEDKIVITDLQPDGFSALLRYIYTGKLQVENVLEASYTRTAAIKYKLLDLSAKCSRYMAANVRPDDVCPLLDNFLTTGEQGADMAARWLLRTQGLAVLNSSNFRTCRECTVKYALDHVVGVREASVIAAVYEWAQQQCLSQNQDEGRVVSVRDVMRPLFSKLRFLALTAKQFVQGPRMWGILDEKEALALLRNIIENDSVVMPSGFCKIRDQPS